MTNRQMSRFGYVLAGAVSAALLCGVGGAQAQDYQAQGYQAQGYQAQGYYDGRGYYNAPPETVIVRPEYGVIQRQQLLGHVDGSIDPTLLTLSQPVSYSDLDLSQASGRRELRHRIRDTAEDVCNELDARASGPDGDEDEFDSCVYRATRNAMRQFEN